MDALENSDDIGRRKFLTGVIGVVAGAVSFVLSVPAVSYLVSPGLNNHAAGEWFPLGPLSDVVPGTPKGYPYARNVKDGWTETTQTGVAYAVTHDGVNVKVYSNICTHLKCRVSWIEDRQIFLSPCHNGIFSIDGDVISGPPPRPLDQFEVKIENGQMSILLV
jgi:menaquinol-cytochrome c reductase iron-sulfur subunit